MPVERLDRRPGPIRLLADLGSRTEPMPLAEHRSRYSPPLRPRRTANGELIELVSRSGLQGRGGAGFPTGRKWGAVAAGPGPRILVANGTEGEPASRKDRLLMALLPHLVLDGVALAAAAVGAEEAVVCVDRLDTSGFAALHDAVADRDRLEEGVSIRVASTPPRYIAGEESGLVHWLNGGPAMPTQVPPRPFERGVDGRPTLVQNVETLAHVTMITAYGPDWFREAGPPDEPGTVVVSVSGAVERPSVFETAIGTPTGALVDEVEPTGPLQALLLGGFFGTWVSAQSAADAPFSRAGLAPLGASPGAGIVVALPEDACGLAETARILSWFSAESAGQCGPCVYGLADLALGMVGLARGEAAPDDVARLWRWASEIEGRGACKHPDGAVRLLRSALRTFAADVDRHVAGTPCDGMVHGTPVIAVPTPPQVWR